jgi:hypothetical protein
MKIRPVLVLVLALAVTGPVFADLTGDVTALFNDFFGRLVAKHEALESLTMPGVEVRGIPGEEDLNQAAVILSFKKSGDQEAFIGALEAEGIPYGTFGEGEREGKLLLFSPDMMIFIMKDAIGL